MDADGYLFYVMPFVDGPSLRDRLDREGELPVQEVVGLLRDVADALSPDGNLIAYSAGTANRQNGGQVGGRTPTPGSV